MFCGFSVESDPQPVPPLAGLRVPCGHLAPGRGARAGMAGAALWGSRGLTRSAGLAWVGIGRSLYTLTLSLRSLLPRYP